MVTLYFYQRKDVAITDINTDCKGNLCRVNFSVVNKTNNYVSCRVSIRALKRTPGAKTSGVVTQGFAGEKLLDLELAPKEAKIMDENLSLTASASRILVKAFNVDKIYK